MSSATTNPSAAVARLAKAKRVLITGHMNPDGDAIGSELALAELATALGVKPVIVNHDQAPDGLRFLPGAPSITESETLPEDFRDAFDLVVTVECPDLDRAGFDGLDQVPILNIDHHKANPLYGEVNYVDESSPAVGEMVWRMFRHAGITPSPDAATNAFVALSTDTGDFRYANATSRAFQAASEMVAAGAEPQQVATWIHQSRSEASVRLLGEALDTLELSANGRLATVWVDEASFSRARATPADTEDIINLPRSIAGVEVVAFLKQPAPDVVKFSLRSKGTIDVRAVAAEMGGGGHTNAAGCTITGEDIATVKARLVARLESLLETGS